jgi:hypothetical protein
MYILHFFKIYIYQIKYIYILHFFKNRYISNQIYIFYIFLKIDIYQIKYIYFTFF